MDHPLTQPFPACLFPGNLTLIPGLREVYELHLAWLEAQTLTGAALVEQAAYFCAVDGQPTRHFLTCIGETLNAIQANAATVAKLLEPKPASEAQPQTATAAPRVALETDLGRRCSTTSKARRRVSSTPTACPCRSAHTAPATSATTAATRPG